MQAERKAVLLRLAEENQTPFYAYFTDGIREKYARLRSVLTGIDPSSTLLYSLKANSHEKVCSALAECGAGADVASADELLTALKAGFSPGKISYTGPGKTEAELELAVAKKVGWIVAESESELKKLSRLKGGAIPSVLLRVNLSRKASQFGFDPADLPSVLKEWSGKLPVDGIHCFWQSQILDADVLLQRFEEILAFTQELYREWPEALSTINLGGGFGIPYFSENELDVEKIARLKNSARLAALVPGRKLLFESGRYLVGEAGVFVTRVLYRKEQFGKKILVLDGGLTDFMAATNLGQILRRTFPVTPLSAGGTMEKVMLAGPSCAPSDLIADEIELPELGEGSLLAIGMAGAYGASYSPVNFLRRPKAKEIVICTEH